MLFVVLFDLNEIINTITVTYYFIGYGKCPIIG